MSQNNSMTNAPEFEVVNFQKKINHFICVGWLYFNKLILPKNYPENSRRDHLLVSFVKQIVFVLFICFFFFFISNSFVTIYISFPLFIIIYIELYFFDCGCKY